MSFFFKSKNKSSGLPQAARNIGSSDGEKLPNSAAGSNGTYAPSKDATEKPRIGSPPAMSTVTPSYPRQGTSSPGPTGSVGDPNAQRDRAGSDSASQIPRNPNLPPSQRAGDLSLYPWSSRKLEFVSTQANPFPRYGAAVNALTSRDGDIYMMGGLINGSTVKGDLWIVEAASSTLNCYPVPTTAEGPGPRVGHASLLVGNAFIVFGGDTKVDEFDALDDTLYLLNTSTKHWSRALPPGPRPAGRYGHTLNILGSKIYIFGGQVEGYFFNDLVAFDLNALQQPTNRWETLIQNTNDGGPPHGQIPPARTNHSVVTWNDKIYLFGGTDGVSWFNDVWVYDPKTNSWSPQECIGFIPAAREGHAAAIVGDVMYVFGGRTEDGKDLGDLAAFRIPTRRWYTFQNMGPSPSPRSGHGMTAFGQLIVVLGGEPSSAPRDPSELSMTYILDTAKIRYPPDRPTQPNQNASARRPSITDRSATPQERSVSREGIVQGGKLSNKDSQESINGSQSSYQGAQDTRMSGALPMANPSARPAGQAPIPGQSGPPSQQIPPQPRTNGIRSAVTNTDVGRESPRPVSKLERVLGPEYARSQSRENMRQDTRGGPLQDLPEQPRNNLPLDYQNQTRQGVSAPNLYEASSTLQTATRQIGTAVNREAPSVQEHQGSIEGTPLGTVPSEETLKPDTESGLPMPGQFPVDSGLGSSPSMNEQNDESSKELETLRSKNAWYASELALARKAGYRSSIESPSTSERSSEHFGDSEKPLVEAFLKMRSELAAMQQNLDTQAKMAAEKVAQVERQRDAAVAEAVYSKTRLAGRGRRSDTETSRDIGTPDSERSEDTNRRLANALSAQSDLTAKVRSLQNDIESERKARQLAEESAETAHTRATELDKHKQASTSELESLKADLHEAQKQARDESANCADAVAAHRLLEVEKNDLAGKLSIIQSDAQSHTSILGTLRSAVTSSTEKSNMLERKLNQEQLERNAIEEKMAQLRTEHEARVQELESCQRRLQDAEELSASHAEEARTHREAILAGFGQSTDRGIEDFPERDERVGVLQQQLESTKLLARRHQDAADQASDRLRRAEERIAGLEAYQEQTSRESLAIRKQLQTASRDALALQAEHTELQQQLTSEKLDAAAVQVQHRALKELLEERGVDTSDLPQPKSFNGTSSVTDRLREVEQQLESSMKSQEDMRTSYEQRELEANRGWEEKLANLDNDYQSAVKYLKGTEKMLSKMKQELHKYKSQNKELEEDLARERSTDKGGEATTQNENWESERTLMQQQLDEMQARVSTSSTQLDQHMAELRAAHVERDSLQEKLNMSSEQSRSDLATLRAQNTALETRAAEAERKVQILLESVGNTVDSYKRQSQQGSQMTGMAAGHSRGPSFASVGDESVYDDDDNLSKADTRNSMALDSLTNELETLRNHWETTHKNYRFSDRSDLGKSGSAGETGAAHENLADWRKKLALEENESVAS